MKPSTKSTYTVYTERNPSRNIPELNRIWFEVLHMTADIPASEVINRVKERAGRRRGELIAVSTLRNLRNGKTRYPTLRTAFLIGRAMGRPLSFGGNQ